MGRKSSWTINFLLRLIYVTSTSVPVVLMWLWGLTCRSTTFQQSGISWMSRQSGRRSTTHAVRSHTPTSTSTSHSGGSRSSIQVGWQAIHIPKNRSWGWQVSRGGLAPPSFRINKTSAFSTNVQIKVCVSCSWWCPETSEPSAPHLEVSLFLCISESYKRVEVKGPGRELCQLKKSPPGKQGNDFILVWPS